MDRVHRFTRTDASGATVPDTDYAELTLVMRVNAHVELASAATAHGAQGDTVPTAHVVVGERTGALRPTSA